MPAPVEILRLIERFSEQRQAYLSGAYNETQVRREFIDPFFEALGWDIFNRQGHAEAYKDVIHEDAVRVVGIVKAPDYCFRIGGRRIFFVEAKKPSVNVKDEPGPAYQLRRYAWSAGLPLSILTDFHELAVYDCRLKPTPTDKPSLGRVLYLTWEQYAEKWDELAALFSREAVLKGSFERWAASGRKKGTADVDDIFLAEIEGWRDLLARHMALRNPDLATQELNFAVQRTIDRIIFLRICEDRGIEDYGRLQALLNGTNVHDRLKVLFQRADERYNSGLFHFRPEKGRAEAPDELTLRLELDDKPLKEIIRGLYYPESPYEFSVLPADILGSVYERFLGKVIRLTAGHQAKVEEKPEVRKAGGVYYTPTYIVDYIVKNTVGKLLEGKTPKQAAKLRILDPACGSGSFLIGAYQYLLDWHRDWYTAHNPEKHASGRNPSICSVLLPSLEGRGRGRVEAGEGESTGTPPLRGGAGGRVEAGGGGTWRLTTAKRKEILLNNIHGVDIDPQAVEVTKLSLLLKVLEGEDGETLSRQLRMFHERALPDLGNNIKCGNSLIGPDYWEGLFPSPSRGEGRGGGEDDEELRRVNPFDWPAEFPHVIASTSTVIARSEATKQSHFTGGFDAVIGNPPYVRQESLSDFKEYLEKNYEAYNGVADLYAYFMERGVKLLRDGGLFSIIVSSSFLRATYGEALRRTLKKHAAVLRIVDFGGLAVFANAKDTYVCIPLLAKGAKQKQVEVSKVTSLKNLNMVEHVAENLFLIPHERLSPESWSLKSDEEAAVFAKVMKAGKPLGEYVERKFFRGLLTGLNEAFEVSAEQQAALAKTSPMSKGLIKPFLGGQDIRRYVINNDDRFLIVIPCGWTRQQMAKAKKGLIDFSERAAWNWFSGEYPKLAEHLAQFADALRKRQDQGNYWWELRSCDYYEYLDAPKIIFPDICKGPRFCVDRTGIYLANTAYCLGSDDLYLLGVLNSRLFWFAISNISIPFGIRAGEYRYRLIYQYMEKVPIRTIDFSDPADKARHDKMVDLVETMLVLHKKLAAARTEDDRTPLRRHIEAVDAQIDRLVYDLYSLTPTEIKIVEGGSTK